MLAIDHDHQLRAMLKVHLRDRITAEDLIVDEFSLPFGAVRADLALVNGHLEGFEIKAGRDTLQRLPAQIDAYNKIFEFSWIVTTADHLSEIRSIVPQPWGVLVAQPFELGYVLKRIRKAGRNVKRDRSHLVRLLWRDELLSKLDSLGIGKGLKSKPKIDLFESLAGAVSLDELAEYVRSCLKARKTWRIANN